MKIFLIILTFLSSTAFAEQSKTTVLNVALSNVPPISFMRQGEVTGINVEIINQIAKDLNLELSFKLFPHARMLKILEADLPDLSILLISLL